MSCTVITSVFNAGLGDYDDLFRVWQYSVRKHMPKADILVLNEAQELPTAQRVKYSAMTVRLKSWAEAAKKIKGDIIFMDVDMVVLGDLSKVFRKFKFDIAYTNRKSANLPINGGILFMRAGAADFIDLWSKVNEKFYYNKKIHNVWRRKCRGMNQPALWYLINHPEKHHKKLISLPCLVYNACEAEWPKMKDNVKVIHLKDTGRRVIDSNYVPTRKGAMKAVEIWRKYDRAERAASCGK